MQCLNLKAMYLPVCGVTTLVSVPCGKCIPCLMNKRGEWSFRLEQEHRVSKSAHFVTLTYDPKHIRTNSSLDKRDLQLYLKRLRKKDGTTRVRYYAVGEYGTHGGRPHYHILLFNSVEQHIRQAWRDCKGQAIGIVHVGLVAPASVAYVTKYIIQKDSYPEGLEKPFATMSRAYGIGAHYLSDDMVDWHRIGDRNYTVRPGNERGRLPRFYRDKIWFKGHPQKDLVSKKSMALSLDKQKKEREYYALKYGSRGPAVMAHAQMEMLSRVKQKIQFTQTM